MGTTLPTASNVRRFTPRANAAPTVSAASHGAGVARATGKLAEAGFAVGLQVRDEAEKAEAEEVSLRMSRYARLLREGGEDDKGTVHVGYSTLEGKAAVDQAGDYSQKIETYRDGLLGGASSDRVRRMANRAVQSHTETGLSSIANTSNKGAKDYRDSTYKAYTQELSERAVAGSTTFKEKGTDNLVQTSVAAIGERVFNYNEAKMGPEAAASAAQEAMSQARVRVLKDLDQRSPKLAEEYLASILAREKEKGADGKRLLSDGDLINPMALTEIRETLDVSGRIEMVQEDIGAMRAQFGDFSTPDQIRAARDHIEKTYSGKDEVSMKAALSGEVSNTATLKRLTDSAYADAAVNHIIGGGTLANLDPKVRAGISSNAHLLNWAGTYHAISARKGSDAAFEPAPTPTGTKYFNDMMQNQDELRSTKLGGMKPHLTKAQYSSLQTRQNTLVHLAKEKEGGRGSAHKAADKIALKWARARSTKFNAGVKGLSKTENKGLLNDLQGDLWDYVTEYMQANKGAEPTEKQMSAKAVSLMTEVVVDPPGYRNKKTLYLFELENMSDEQRESLVIRKDEREVVDGKHPPPIQEKNIDKWLRGQGFTAAQIKMIPERDRGQIAGSMVTRNATRLSAILARLKAVR